MLFLILSQTKNKTAGKTRVSNSMKLSKLRERYEADPRPKKLRFFRELKPQTQESVIAEECERGERFDWDDAAILTEDFKTQLAERGFPETKVFWSLGYCQGDGVAFYGSVYPQDLKEKDPQARKLIEVLEKSGDNFNISISGENNHYHHWNSMTVEVEFESDEDEDLPPRLRIARPVLREQFEEYLAEKVMEISRELEKCGYAEIEYRTSESAIREDLSERDHLYTRNGELVLREYEFYEWLKNRSEFD